MFFIEPCTIHFMDSCDARTRAYKNGKTFDQCKQIAETISAQIAKKINETGVVSWTEILETVDHDRAHNGHAHCRTDRAKESESGRNLAEASKRESILDYNSEEAHHDTDTQTRDDHIEYNLTLGGCWCHT